MASYHSRCVCVCRLCHSELLRARNSTFALAGCGMRESANAASGCLPLVAALTHNSKAGLLLLVLPHLGPWGCFVEAHLVLA